MAKDKNYPDWFDDRELDDEDLLDRDLDSPDEEDGLEELMKRDDEVEEE